MNNKAEEDYLLIKEAVNGNKKSLETLVKKYQNGIYNIALKMVYYPDDASDVTQEVLIKIITSLASFRFESTFKTWMYRITVNHILNLKKSRAELLLHGNFRDYGNDIDRTPDSFIDTNSPETNLIVEEVKITCLQGMLLCLNRRQRMAFILGSIFLFPDNICSELMDISRDNFRQLLSRARKDIMNFMNDRCGLIRKSNPCHCHKKTKAMIESGGVNPEKLLFNKDYLYSIESGVQERLQSLDDFIDDEGSKLFRTLPYNEMKDFTEKIREIMDSSNFKDVFNLN